ncbi:MAG: site-specific integrase [Desulfovibrio sp.]|jgi:integrase|nr:site-specific integrase [Desulfovibrio sp.]
MLAFFKKKTSISGWKDAYLDFCAAKNVENTRRAKAFAFRVLLATFPGGTNVAKITKQGALAFLLQVARERGGGSANEVRKRLRAAWNWGVEFLDMPEVNPFRVPKFPQDERPRYVPPLGDFKAVHALTSGADYAMLLTVLHTAARRGEIFRMTWDDVDFQRGIVRLGTRKRAGGGLQYDWVPMTSALKETLTAHKNDSRGCSGLVFPRPDGCPYKTRANLLKKLCAEGGIKRFSFHAVRHLAASLMAQKGMGITSIQAILRHTTPLTTARYLHRLGVPSQDLDSVFSTGPP